MTTIHRNLLGLVLVAAVAVGCSPAAGPSKTELPIHRLQEVTERAQVEKLALDVIPGARPLPGDQGLIALQADGLLGVAITPESWAVPAPKMKSTDYMILLMSLPNEHKRFREPLMIKLREAISARNGHAWTKPALMAPFVLKVGGYDYLGQKVDSQTVNGTKATEYWLEFPQKDRVVHLVAAGLPGFGAYFPDERFGKFLAQLPKVDISTPAALETP